MADKDTYKVSSYMEYGVAQVYYRERFFRFYWQADLYSWLMHNLMGCSCNTWVKDGANVKPRPVRWVS